MDQLKNILKPLAKYHFWILCVVAITAAVVGWFMASKALTAVYNQQKSTIEGKFKSLVALQGEQNPPNETWKVAVSELTSKQKQSVGTAWTKVYDEQKDVLKWPADILGEEFVKAVDSHATDWDIDLVSKNVYYSKIHEAFPNLLKIVDAAPAVDPKTLDHKTADAKTANTETHDHKLAWAPGSQRLVKDTLEWSQVPSSTEIRRAQEDLWVYTALLRIIASTNKDSRWTSPVKELVDIRIGKEAAHAFAEGLRSGHIVIVQGAAPQPGGEQPAAPAPQQPAAPVDGAAASAASSDDGRYVDADGKPQSTAEAAQKPFKRMPVLLNLVMDQRELPRLLTECANSPLPVEIKQLRVNPEKSNAGSSGSRTAKPTTGGGNAGNSRGGAKSDSTSYDVPVELMGIIYIYNRPPSEPPAGTPPAAPAG